MKVALYTVTYSGIFYDGDPLSLEEIFPRVADMGFDGVEIGAKRPVASPMDMDGPRRAAIRALGPRYGLEIGCVASYSNFASPVMEQREAELLMLREIIRLAHDLEAPVVRIFAGWRGMTLRNGRGTYDMVRSYRWPDVTWLEQWQWARACIEESCRWAEQYGVTLALQNHDPVVNNHQQTLEMIHEVNSPWLKACIDAPLLTQQDDAFVRQAILDTGNLQVWSHFGGFTETADGKISEETGDGTKIVNYPAFFRALRDIGYKGYIAYEGCGPALVNHNLLGIEEADRRARAALAYMRKQIAAVNG